MLYLKFSILKFLVLTGLFSHLVFGSQLEAVITAKYEAEPSGSEIDSTNSAQPCLSGVVCRTRTNFIKDVTINPSHWKLNQRVTFSFRTTDEFENIKVVNLVVHEIIERDGSSVPKHVFKGFILRAFTIKPNSRYEATFVPPYFWNSGTYLLTMSVNKQVENWEQIGGYDTWNSFEEEFVIQVGAEADASFEKVISLPQRPRSENKENRDTTNLELDIFRSILGSLRSAFEVCSFCQSFENAHKNCKAIFDTNGPKPPSAVSIGQICSIGKLERKIQELEVKYIGLPNQYTALDRNSWLYAVKMIRIRSQVNLKNEDVWIHTDLIEHTRKHLLKRLKNSAREMQLFYKFPGLSQMIHEIPVHEAHTLSDMDRFASKLLELPSENRFKEKLMGKFFQKYEGQLSFLGFNSPVGAVAVILKSENLNLDSDDPEYARWSRGILRAWDLL